MVEPRQTESERKISHEMQRTKIGRKTQLQIESVEMKIVYLGDDDAGCCMASYRLQQLSVELK